MLSSFSCASWPSVCLLWRSVYLGLLPIFGLGCFFIVVVELHELFIYFGNKSFVHWFICKYFLPFWGLSFCLVYGSFAVQKLLSFIRSHFFIFVFISITPGGRSKNILLWFMSKSVLPMFSSKSLIVSGYTFSSLIHFEFIFVHGVRECSNFIL